MKYSIQDFSRGELSVAFGLAVNRPCSSMFEDQLEKISFCGGTLFVILSDCSKWINPCAETNGRPCIPIYLICQKCNSIFKANLFLPKEFFSNFAREIKNHNRATALKHAIGAPCISNEVLVLNTHIESKDFMVPVRKNDFCFLNNGHLKRADIAGIFSVVFQAKFDFWKKAGKSYEFYLYPEATWDSEGIPILLEGTQKGKSGLFYTKWVFPSNVILSFFKFRAEMNPLPDETVAEFEKRVTIEVLRSSTLVPNIPKVIFSE